MAPNGNLGGAQSILSMRRLVGCCSIHLVLAWQICTINIQILEVRREIAQTRSLFMQHGVKLGKACGGIGAARRELPDGYMATDNDVRRPDES